MSDKVYNLTDSNFESETSEGLVLVDFWAPWCGPCRSLAPTIDELADTYEGKVKVAKVNVDENQQIPGKFGVRGIPTVILLKDGQQINQMVGSQPAGIKDMLTSAVG